MAHLKFMIEYTTCEYDESLKAFVPVNHSSTTYTTGGFPSALESVLKDTPAGLASVKITLLKDKVNQ